MALQAGALLFDIDGTLVDSTPVVERSWRAWADEYGVDAEAVLRVCHGRRSEDTVADFIAPAHRAAATARVQEIEAGDFDGIVALPGALAVLELLPRRRWAAVTSGGRTLMTTRLAIAHLPVPDILVSAEDVVEGKPSAEGYRRAAGLLGITAEQCIVVEDAPAGVAAGRAAGARVLAVTTTHTASELADADVIVRDLSCVSVGATGTGIVIGV